jgi:membrane fusion protein, multidrug efflux system
MSPPPSLPHPSLPHSALEPALGRTLALDSPPKHRKRAWILAAAGLLLVLLVLVGIKVAQIRSMIAAGKSFVMPPESVTSATAEQAEWQGARSAVGTLIAVRSVTLGAELSGVVRGISFDSGTFVKKGSVLVTLDTSLEQAQLSGSVADSKLAKQNLERSKSLQKGGVTTVADLEAAEARALQATSAVASLQATIAKKAIRAPFDGRVAIRQVELGQLVSQGTAIASLQSVTPIYAEFALPQQALADVKLGQKASMHVDIFPGSSWDGEISTINPEVDVATRNVRVRATFQNTDGRLTPGMFANIDVLSNEKNQVVVIPATSVIFAPFGDSVFAIEEKKDAAGHASSSVHQKFVRLGERRGDFVVAISGVTPGEVLVSNGGFKLRNGQSVIVNNSLAPKADIAPAPTEK